MDLSTIICDLEEADKASPRVKIEQSGCIDIVITVPAFKRVFYRDKHAPHHRLHFHSVFRILMQVFRFVFPKILPTVAKTIS